MSCGREQNNNISDVGVLHFLKKFNLLLSICMLVLDVNAKQLPDLQWNSTNPLFGRARSRLNNAQRHESFPISVVSRNDYVDFVCPETNAAEWLVVSMVSEMSFLSCQLDSSAVDFLVCDGSPSAKDDSRPRRRRVIFREVSDASNAVSFTPGHSYYFISTSNGNKKGFRNALGGFCVTKNMRLQLDVVYNRNDNKTEKEEEEATVAPSIEYLIEERDPDTMLRPVGESVAAAFTRDANDLSLNAVAPTFSRSLADILHVKPEYLDFVRRHAVNGGTGAIEFPNPNAGKRPRFVIEELSTKRNQDFYINTNAANQPDTSIDSVVNEREFDNDESRLISSFSRADRAKAVETRHRDAFSTDNFISMKVYSDGSTSSSSSASESTLVLVSSQLTLFLLVSVLLLR